MMRRRIAVLTTMSLVGIVLLAGCSKDPKQLPEKDNEKEIETAELVKIDNDTDPIDMEDDGHNEDEEDESKPVDGGGIDYERYYAPVLNEVLEVVTEGYDFEREYQYISDGLMEKTMYPGDDDLTQTVGYELRDVSGDGIPELMIGCNEDYGNVAPHSYIYNVFTLVNEKPVSVFEGWARSSYRWMGDDHFYYCGSGGASITIFGQNHLSRDGSEIIWDDFYFSDEKEDGEIGLYHNTSGIFDADEAEELKLSDSEFFAKMDEYEERCELLSWTPIGSTGLSR